ncbi:DNA-directed DNA polymerase [Geobacter metallireducens RCH3]|uniref:DNA polymerase IV n=1 Tax=Geobacter metallireducens (strain ATCC 53774 / DSM 7210 / GS-15) TaxID=269799 RepID=Q39VP9_GEOMG|nr:DNA polymerase IV [Geobacter metallireducens]ABB31675.2 DNA polymerase IV [Geobacter metallireducens GS-15]EHP89449.1 DNA-directed DNA polymerase [Geobacter metallireducens RCH3]
MSGRVIMHVDMNAFFASVEQQHDPALRGKPIAVIGSAARTVITTASYEARAFGVKTGMTVWQAQQKCPQIILVTGDNRKYTYTSARIVEMMKQFTPLVEVFSIDEAFLDVTGSLSLYSSAERIAFLLKAEIRHHFGLTCSIGIAPNKLLAKLASEMKKPDGLTVIKPDDVAPVLETLPIKELCGIGAKMECQLNLLGIRTCGELGRYPVDRLMRKFGIVGEKLHLMGQGIDDSPVVPHEEAEEVKSVGHSTTLEHDIEDRREILRWLLQLSEMVGRRARRYNVWGKTVTLSIRYADFDTWVGRQETLPHHINQSDDIYRAAVAILDTLVLEQPVRLLGVRLSNLRYESNQLPLFEEERKKVLLAGAMDQVNDRFGDFAVTFGSLLDKERRQEKGSHVISPAWRPEGIRNVDVK